MGEHTFYSDKELKIHSKISIVKVPYYQGTYFQKLVQYYKDVIARRSLPYNVSTQESDVNCSDIADNLKKKRKKN